MHKQSYTLVSLSLVCGFMLAMASQAHAAPAKKSGNTDAVDASESKTEKKAGSTSGHVTYLNEFTAGANTSLGYEHTTYKGNKTDTFTFGLYGGYRYMILSPMLQLGGEIDFHYTTNGDVSGTRFALLVGPTVNFGPKDLRDAFFAEARLGVAVDNGALFVPGGDSRGLFAWKVGGGKRFRITDSVSYIPSFYISGTAGDGASVALTLNALAFSFFM